jgi:hypothetical protein
MDQTNKCKKCKNVFSTPSNLDKHSKKARPCNSVFKCNKCDKMFKYKSDLVKHQNRKTPCDPIQGDPTKQTPKNTCHFCYKKLSSKYSLKNHFNNCKIKNGGMALLFKKVKDQGEKIKHMEKENKEMKEQISKTPCANMIVNGSGQNIETQNIANHINTTFNFTLINFGEGQEEIVKILAQEIQKLGLDGREDIPYIKQVKDRIIGLVMQVHRNPEQKELQNIYVTNPESTNDNAFFYEEGKWKITDWSKLNSKVLRNLYNNLERSKLHKKKDKLEVMKHIFVISGCGDRDTIKKMTDDDVTEMYLEIGNKLNFKTISL